MTVFRHVINGTFPGDSWSVTMHTQGTVTTATANTIFETAWGALWNGVTPPTDDIKQLVPIAVTCDTVATSGLDPVTFKQVTKEVATLGLPGTDAGATLPPQDTVVVSFTSALASKKGRGRMYLPVFGADKTAGGRLTAAAQTIVQLGMANFGANLIASGLTPVIFNRVSGITQAITGGSVGDVIDTQRRRRGNLIESRMTFLF